MGTLEQGAENAVEVCMGVKPGEHILVVTDRPTIDVGKALFDAADRISKGNAKLMVLEDYTSRPSVQLPNQILEAVPWANVTFYAAESKPGELSMRTKFMDAVKRSARHGHMPSITRKLMETGMCADYMKISDLTRKITNAVKNARKAKVTNRSGTNLEVEFNPAWKWVPCTGIYHEKGKWGNLPEGETYTAPFNANGTMVIDELGDWFSPRYGIITETPVTVRVKESRADLSTLECKNQQLRKELLEYLQTDSNSNRLGEFAIGTNTFLTELSGVLLQDEKFPTVHCAFGHPYSDETGADWDSGTHVDGIMLKCSVWIDDRQIMDEGQHLIS